MAQTVRWLRISYWGGIIADAVMAVLMLLPRQFIAFTNIEIDLTPDFDYGLRYGAPLMIGWTVLLLWADRRPLARRDILPITLLVLAGYITIEIYNLNKGYTSLAKLVPILLPQIVLSVLYVFSYLNARHSPHEA